jgi:hypothetical protein
MRKKMTRHKTERGTLENPRNLVGFAAKRQNILSKNMFRL